MNLRGQDSFEELYSFDFLEAWLEWMKLNLEYMSTYVTTFLKIVSNIRKGGTLDTIYQKWLTNMDRELEHELRSTQFTTSLKQYMNSTIKLRSRWRKSGFPVEFYDVLFYSIKKLLMTFYGIFYIRDSGYSSASEMEYKLGKITLRHYLNNSEHNLPMDRPPVLLVYAQINRFNIFDISQDRSVVKNLMLNGLDVYVLDWGYSGREDDNRSLDDYVEILSTVVNIINLKSKRKRLSIVGYCWGGLISLIFAALHVDVVQNIAIMASPVDSSKDSSLLAAWGRSVDADNMIDEFGHMDGQILDVAFIMRNPPRNLFDKYLKMFRNSGDKHFVDSFFAVENWLFSTPPIPGALYRQIINDIYKKNLLINNGISVNGKQVDLKKIDIPLLTIVAENDDLVSPSSTTALNECVSSEDKHTMRISGGHVGLCISRRAHEKLWPEVADWLISKRKK